MPKGGEAAARLFYGGHLGLRELAGADSTFAREGVWFDAGGLHLHLTVEEARSGTDTERHFGLGCGDLEGLRRRLKAAGLRIDDGPPGPLKCFFIYDPFGNRIEIHHPGGARP